MSANGTLSLVWANGEDAFCIAKVGSILALEEKCDAGIAEILRRLQIGTWRLNDVRETIRLGLIGGGMSPEKAMAAVKLHVDEQPLAKSVTVAYAVLAAALIGVPDDPVGKTTAAGAETQAEVDQASSTTTAASAAQPSTDTAPASDGLHDKSTISPSGKSPPASMATTVQILPTSHSPSP